MWNCLYRLICLNVIICKVKWFLVSGISHISRTQICLSLLFKSTDKKKIFLSLKNAYISPFWLIWVLCIMKSFISEKCFIYLRNFFKILWATLNCNNVSHCDRLGKLRQQEMPVDPLSLRIYPKDLPIPITVKLPSIYFNSDTGVSSYNLNSKFFHWMITFKKVNSKPMQQMLKTDAKIIGYRN